MTESTAKARAAIIPVTPLQQNCTLLWEEDSKRAVVVDPGGDVPAILEAIAETGVTVEAIWLTHGHLDHVGGAEELRAALKVPVIGPHLADKFLCDHVVESAAQFGLTGMQNVTPDRWLTEGETLALGALRFEILHCPGHSPGSVVFFNPQMRFALVGDVLFNGSVGRTDLPGGSHATLIQSITTKLLPLGDDVGFICGHGPGSTLGDERRSNPFLTGEA
jgi:glyoxylase-like metal-dependent hydrolase (beta-lactamase superfamily II)